ncbi:MAG: hypothetical protein EOP42_26425 [Sphingobacteriaceae bacterium]|nr:MAG: hypothetical protein EOP42_26425 [Sphingobacteriaceae bacterium]
MKTLTVNIDNEKDLVVMEEILTRFGLNYQIDTDHQFSDSEIQALIKTKQEFLEGKSSARIWVDIEQELNNAYN